ncbi:MAG: putative toxin-antitoxin system toxin component, PIN family [Anaerolineae bacterium]|nr:putative toxin-antitoxin system toxin component, PIN family [Anaerolineae bacterium]
MIRVVIDTGVFIRYLIKPSAAIKELIEVRWLNDEIALVSAPELMAELTGVLKRDYIRKLIQPENTEALLEIIYRKVELLPALGEVPVYSRDPKDDKFIACALAAGVPDVITVDEDLLILAEVGGARLLTPYQFLARFRK